MLADLVASHPGPLVPGLEVRPPGGGDLEAVTRLYADAAAARGGATPLRREDLRVRWLMLGDPREAVLLTAPGGLAAYASAVVDLDPDTGEATVHLDGQIHPDWTGRGLAGHLLAAATAAGEQALSETGTAAEDAGTGPGPTLRVRTALVDGDDHARTWFARRGFRPVRHLLELHLDLHAPPPAPRWPAGFTVRGFEPGVDDEALWRTHQGAFADVPTHLPIARTDYLADRAPDADPGLVWLVEHRTEPGDAEVVAVAVCRAGTEVAAGDGWVRDLGVLPAWRRRGVAMALLRTTFAAFRDRGLTGVALEVDDVTLDGAVALYRRAGMRVTRRTDVLERLSRPG